MFIEQDRHIKCDITENIHVKNGGTMFIRGCGSLIDDLQHSVVGVVGRG